MLLNSSWLLCETSLAKRNVDTVCLKHCVENILAVNGEIQRVKDIICGKKETCKDREE